MVDHKYTRWVALLAALLVALALAAWVRPLSPPCRVAATSAPRLFLGDRQLVVVVRLPCGDSVAHLRYASRFGGVLPASPPGYFTLAPGRVHSKPVGARWWLEWRDQSGRWWRVPENQLREAVN